MALEGRQIVELVRKCIDPLWQNVRLLVSRAVLDLVDDSKGIQVVKLSLLADEVQEVERFQNYGFTSVPIKDSAEGIAVFVGGNREHGVCIALDDREYRLKDLGEGQAALYDASGSYIVLGNDGSVSVFAEKVIVNSGDIELGNDTLESALNGESFQALFNAHTHVGNAGAATSAPIQQSVPTDLSTQVKVSQ